METADVIVVGAGANGSSTAFHLAQMGAGKVVVVEQGHLASGASGKSGALVRTSYANEPETRLAVESIKYFANWQELVGGDCGFQKIGLLTFTAPEHRDRLEARVAMHRELGVDAQVISPEAAQELDPSLYVGDVDVVEYEPDSGYADPNATVFSFARAATAKGVEFKLGTRVTRILTDMDDAERGAGEGEQPVGRVRLNTSASYATHVLAGILPDFLDRYPEVTIDLVQTDLVVDLLAERIDVAVRAGPLKSSSLVARKLGDTAMMIVAAPSYLDRFGEPKSVEDLEDHQRLGFGYARSVEGWPLRQDGQTTVVPVVSRVQASDGECLRRLALGGSGLVRVAVFTVRDDLAAGRLVPVLGHLNPGDREAFHAIHVGQGGPLPSRVRALLDFLAERGRVEDGTQCPGILSPT